MNRYDGITYSPDFDYQRLESQLERIQALMGDHEWRTLSQIRNVIGGSEAGISARLRDCRKEKFGSYIVNRRRVGDPSSGLFQYQLINPTPSFKFEVSGQGSFL